MFGALPALAALSGASLLGLAVVLAARRATAGLPWLAGDRSDLLLSRRYSEFERDMEPLGHDSALLLDHTQ